MALSSDFSICSDKALPGMPECSVCAQPPLGSSISRDRLGQQVLQPGWAGGGSQAGEQRLPAPSLHSWRLLRRK